MQRFAPTLALLRRLFPEDRKCDRLVIWNDILDHCGALQLLIRARRCDPIACNQRLETVSPESASAKTSQPAKSKLYVLSLSLCLKHTHARSHRTQPRHLLLVSVIPFEVRSILIDSDQITAPARPTSRPVRTYVRACVRMSQQKQQRRGWSLRSFGITWATHQS